jgi:hypothetical protein
MAKPHTHKVISSHRQVRREPAPIVHLQEVVYCFSAECRCGEAATAGLRGEGPDTN